MGEMIETTSTGKTVTKWYSNVLTPQNVVLLLGLLASACFFVFRMNQDDRDIKEKADRAEVIQLKEQIKDLEDRVSRQYSTARDDREKEMKSIEEALDWIEFQKGYKQAMDDNKRTR